MLRTNRLRQSSVRLCTRQYSENVSSSSGAAGLNALAHEKPTSQPAHAPIIPNDGSLFGRSIAVKDNIVTADQATAAASLALEDYRSPFDATVVRLLRENGASVTGELDMDEFGMGSHSQNSYSAPVKSPFVRGGKHLSPGGSSGGSAVGVALKEFWAALGTDTGGSVRLPAAYTGIVGFKPSYGALSRWGVIQYANSLDTVGILARRTDIVRTVFSVLNSYDALDPTSLPIAVRARFHALGSHDRKTLRIGIPLEYNIAELAAPVKQTYISLLNALQASGHTLHPVSLPSTRLALSAYYILAPAEASSNLAKYDGVRYGHCSDSNSTSAGQEQSLPLYASTRGESFGPEVQRRILLGAYSLSAAAKDNYFLQAQRVRRLVQRDFDNVFAQKNPLVDEDGAGKIFPWRRDTDAEVDLLLTPTAPTLPPTIEEVGNLTSVENYMNDVFTVPASLAGLPAISVPAPLGDTLTSGMEETDVKTVGMQVIGQFGDDDLVLDMAETIEKLYHY